MAWSTRRLPFERFPQPWMWEFRDEMRASVRELRVEPNEVLHAAYAAGGDVVCDLENVLLYNVGTSHLRYLMGRGVRIERSYVPSQEPSATTPVPRPTATGAGGSPPAAHRASARGVGSSRP